MSASCACLESDGVNGNDYNEWFWYLLMFFVAVNEAGVLKIVGCQSSDSYCLLD